MFTWFGVQSIALAEYCKRLTPSENVCIKSLFDVPTNVFMELELMEGGLKNVSGTVKYPKEFDTV